MQTYNFSILVAVSLLLVSSLLLTGCDQQDVTQQNEISGRLESLEQSQESFKAEFASKLEGLSDTSRRAASRLDELESRALAAANSSVLPQEQPDSQSDQESKALLKRVAELETQLAQLAISPVTEQGNSVAASSDKAAAAPKVPNKKTSKPKKRAGVAGKLETTLLSWNVESEGSDPALIAKQLAEFNRYDVYGLTEVLPEAAASFADALGPGYESLVSRTGYNDRLQLIFNTKKYRLLRRLELDDINFERRYRSPLVAHLEHLETGRQVMFMVNHLARGRAEVREKQAEQLVEWAREQNVPIVAIGDYNFDWVFATRKGNAGFTAMMRDGIWKWLEPVELIDTNWFDNPSRPDGKDDYPGSILDFAFVAGSATEWKAECRVIVRPNDFPDDETTSDHRPFEVYLATE